MPSATNPAVSDPLLQALVAEYQAAMAAGQPISVAQLLARHPDAGPEVARALAAALGGPETLDQTAASGAGGAVTLEVSGIVPAAAVPFGGQFGDYELLAEVARGGMGVVFKA